MTQEQLRMQMLAGIITESQYKKKLNENMLSVGSNVNLPDADMGVGIIDLVTDYASYADEIDADLGMDWESMTPKEELTWYKITTEDGETHWFDEEELGEYN
jgi:hypothetical protein